MRFEIKMPDLATTESDIRIVRWLIEPGQPIERGRPLLEVETDKATMEVESVASGVLLEVLSPANEAVSVGQVIAVLEVHAEAESVPLLQRSSVGSTPTPTNTACKQAVAQGGAIGMFARNRTAAAGAKPPASPAAIPLSVAERVAGNRLQQSKQTIPHFYLQTSANAAAMIARRKAAEPAKLVWDAFFIQAVAKAILKFDRFRCRLDGERLTPADTDAVGGAVDVAGELYIVPIASAAAKTVETISEEIRRCVQKLRDGDAEAKKIRPALMTVTNLGSCNVESFIPIISPPEPAILGIGRVMPVPVARDAERVAVEHRCTLTLCVDHRVCSGKYAGEFLGAIVQELESFPCPNSR